MTIRGAVRSPAPAPMRAAAGRGWPARAAAAVSRHRLWLIIGAITAAVLALLLASALSGSARDPLGADNPAPGGARAVVEILRGQGVRVTPTDTFDATMKELAGAERATVLVSDPTLILDAGRLARLAGTGAVVVLVQPGPADLDALAAQITSAGVGPDAATVAPAGCDNPAAIAAGESETASGAGQGRLYRGPVTCFAAPGSTAGSYVTSADGRIRVVGNGAVLSNGRLDRSGNAALALNALGSRPTLVWYLPALADLPAGGQPSLADLTPGWVSPAVIWLMIVAVLAMLWKGVRDGPLVPEPLPVVVRASETAAGRARLYQDARAVDRAAANLRAAALTRLAGHFRLGGAATARDVADALARHGPRTAADIDAVLCAGLPLTDSALLAWAQDLEELEKEATAP